MTQIGHTDDQDRSSPYNRLLYEAYSLEYSSTWKGLSGNFGMTEFSEVDLTGPQKLGNT
jgi:hypothetical protein